MPAKQSLCHCGKPASFRSIVTRKRLCYAHWQASKHAFLEHRRLAAKARKALPIPAILGRQRRQDNSLDFSSDPLLTDDVGDVILNRF